MPLSAKTLNCYKIFMVSIVILELCTTQERRYAHAAKIEGSKHRSKMYSASYSQNLRGQAKSDILASALPSKEQYGRYDVDGIVYGFNAVMHHQSAGEERNSRNVDLTLAETNFLNLQSLHVNMKQKIRSVSGEPDYKSVNLTWEVEFVPVKNDAASINRTNLAEQSSPPKTFQIFFCELQSFGPHRCRSKMVNESAVNTENETSKYSRHFSAQIDNLRMATKYSFHIRPQAKFGRMKMSARSGIFDNEIYEELNFGEKAIIIPTKGFSAEATKCLPHASEIEVETGPHFAGKIVVDGGNCGVKGNPDDPKDKYTMRIDHKICGSLVKPETNTVETFITVQENLGIFTHSTRRFVVVCSFQSGMQTVRASFMVPGGDGVAAAMDNDPFQPDQQTRLGREQRRMRYVDKSALVLKENNKDDSDVMEQEVATVMQVADPALSADAANSVATLEHIIPNINEADIKHESNTHNRRDVRPLPPRARSAKYAKLIFDPNDMNEQRHAEDDINDTARAYDGTLHSIAGNVGSIVLTVSVSVIIVGVFIFIVYWEVQRRRSASRQNPKLENQQQLQQKPQKHSPQGTLPITLKAQQTGST